MAADRPSRCAPGLQRPRQPRVHRRLGQPRVRNLHASLAPPSSRGSHRKEASESVRLLSGNDVQIQRFLVEKAHTWISRGVPSPRSCRGVRESLTPTPLVHSGVSGLSGMSGSALGVLPTMKRTTLPEGWRHRLMSPVPKERANRVLVASRVDVELAELALPTFDHQLPANVLSVPFPGCGLGAFALRVPAYKAHQQDLTGRSWAWLESVAEALVSEAAVIIGDLNVPTLSTRGVGAVTLRRLGALGWSMASSATVGSYFSPRGIKEHAGLPAPRADGCRSSSSVCDGGGRLHAGGLAGCRTTRQSLQISKCEVMPCLGLEFAKSV